MTFTASSGNTAHFTERRENKRCAVEICWRETVTSEDAKEFDAWYEKQRPRAKIVDSTITGTPEQAAADCDKFLARKEVN